MLSGVSLSVGPGEIIAILGPNGAGKSTLLRVIAGAIPAQRGRILFRDEEVTECSIHIRARRGIAFCMQGAPVMGNLSVEEHLLLGTRVGSGRGSNPTGPAHVLRLGLKARMGDPAGVLSGGERQALALATALSTRPALLLADEPSTGLSPAITQQIIKGLVEISESEGLSIIWVEQQIPQLLRVADRAIMLKGGRVIATTEKPEAWLDGELLAHLTSGQSGDRD